MAQELGDYFASRTVARVLASPLLRTRQTARPIADAHGFETALEPRVIEGTNIFEGTRVSAKTIVRSPRMWPRLWNPLRPSWGESYHSILRRMHDAMADAWGSVDSGEVVIVSHQLPIWLVQRRAAKRSLPHVPSHRRCALASVTSFIQVSSGWQEVAYKEPASELLVGAIDLGAV